MRYQGTRYFKKNNTSTCVNERESCARKQLPLKTKKESFLWFAKLILMSKYSFLEEC